MNNKYFKQYIQWIKIQALPDCSGTIEANVLRRIRLTRQEATQSVWDWLADFLPQPACIVSLLAIIITLSSGVSLFTVSRFISMEQNQQMAASALNFESLVDTDYFNLHSE